MVKSRSGMDVVFIRWKSIISLFRGYISLGFKRHSNSKNETLLPGTYERLVFIC